MEFIFTHLVYFLNRNSKNSPPDPVSSSTLMHGHGRGTDEFVSEIIKKRNSKNSPPDYVFSSTLMHRHSREPVSSCLKLGAQKMYFRHVFDTYETFGPTQPNPSLLLIVAKPVPSLLYLCSARRHPLPSFCSTRTRLILHFRCRPLKSALPCSIPPPFPRGRSPLLCSGFVTCLLITPALPPLWTA